MNRRPNRTLVLALLATAAAAALAAGASRADEPGHPSHPGDPIRQEKLRLIWNAEGERDRLAIDELALEPGESQEFTTDSGRTARVTRDADGDGLTIDVDGRQIRVGGGEDGELPGRRVILKREGPGEVGETVVLGEDAVAGQRIARKVVVESDGETKSFVVSDVDPDVVFLRGEPGEHAFAFGTGGLSPRLPFERLMDRIEKSEKFLALDDATREIVREVVRDATPELELRHGLLPGEGGEDVHVVVERRVEEKAD